MPPRSKRHSLRIEPAAQAWVRLRVDRKLVFEGNLPAGRAMSWDGNHSFGLRTPREGALRVWLDEQPLELGSFPRDSFGNLLIQPPTDAAAAKTAADQKPTGAATAPPLIP